MTTKRPAHRPSKGERAKHTLRLPIELDQPLRQRAEHHGRSLNDEMVAILAAVLSSTPASVADAYANKAARWKKPGELTHYDRIACVFTRHTNPEN